MARAQYEDFAELAPAETMFKAPGGYENSQEARSSTKAQYLSSMDQFYAGLNVKEKELEELRRWNDMQYEIAMTGLEFEKEAWQEAQDNEFFSSLFSIAGAGAGFVLGGGVPGAMFGAAAGSTFAGLF